MCRQIEAQTIDLIISEDEDISIEVTGKKLVLPQAHVTFNTGFSRLASFFS